MRTEWGKFAWWWLSANQKKVLKEQRQKGRFGGTPWIPKYGWIHDKGMPEVGIRGVNFMAKAKPQVRQLVKEAMARAAKKRAG